MTNEVANRRREDLSLTKEHVTSVLVKTCTGQRRRQDSGPSATVATRNKVEGADGNKMTKLGRRGEYRVVVKSPGGGGQGKARQDKAT